MCHVNGEVGGSALCLLLIGCLVSFGHAGASEDDSPFHSTLDLGLDSIVESDDSAFLCLEYEGLRSHQIWDKRVDDESTLDVYSFSAHFDGQQPIEMVVNPEYSSVEEAREAVLPVAEALGRVYLPLRRKLGRVALHKGSEGLHAGGYQEGYGQIVVYAETVRERLAMNHLEESLFHEAVHAAWDREYAAADIWVTAQTRDGRFATSYAREFPQQEDLAETALLAYALSVHPDRVPSDISDALVESVPNRLKALNEIMQGEEDAVVEMTATGCGS